jgi:hypothetical protein
MKVAFIGKQASMTVGGITFRRGETKIVPEGTFDDAEMATKRKFRMLGETTEDKKASKAKVEKVKENKGKGSVHIDIDDEPPVLPVKGFSSKKEALSFAQDDLEMNLADEDVAKRYNDKLSLKQLNQNIEDDWSARFAGQAEVKDDGEVISSRPVEGLADFDSAEGQTLAALEGDDDEEEAIPA